MIKYINKNFNKNLNKNFNRNFNDFKEILIFFLPVVLLCFGYSEGLKKTFKNGYKNKCPLNNTVFKLCYQAFEICKKYFSLWPISHLLIYILATLRFHKLNQIILLFFLGIIWEIIETYGSGLDRWFTSKKDYIDVKKIKLSKNVKMQYTTYWTGTFSDIVFNTIGMIIGILIIKFNFFPVFIKNLLNTIFIICLVCGAFYINLHPIKKS